MSGTRQPIELIVAKGKKHIGKNEIEERKKQQIKAPNENINAPSYLPEDLRVEFDKISKILINIGIMSDLDETALGRFLVAEYQYQQVTAKMLKMKIINDKYFDYAKLQDRFFKQARVAASDLGLTISSRCKLVLPKAEEEKPKNKFNKFAK